MLSKKFFTLSEVQKALGLNEPNKDVEDMLKIVNHRFVPEPKLFEGCPLLILNLNGKKNVFAIWKEFGIAVRRYEGRFVYWLLKFNPAEEFDPNRTVIISCGDELHPSGNVISYFSDAEKIASAIIYITNTYKAEQEFDNRFSDKEESVNHCNELTERRYNSTKGMYESFPDWLGGMESEEDFWEH